MLDANVSIQNITWLLLTILSFAASMALLAGRKRRLETNQDGEFITVQQVY